MTPDESAEGGGDKRPRISVVVCTYAHERLPQLQRSLGSLSQQTYEESETIVIVDHNPELLEQINGLHVLPPRSCIAPNVQVRGLSGARNSGIAIAQGEIVAFIDDDAVAEPNWLEEIVRAYHSPDVIGTGGPVLPEWEGGDAPSWLPPEYLWVVGCTYRGMATAGSIRNPIGCNMSFRADVFAAAGCFNVSLGRVGKRPVGCEETEMAIRAQKLWPESEIRFVSEAAVHHLVPKERQTFAYFRSRCYSEGISKAIVQQLVGPEALSSESSYALRTLPKALVRNAKSALTPRSAGVALAQIAIILFGLVWTAAGYARGKLWRGGENLMMIRS